jgi:hypothetical protein
MSATGNITFYEELPLLGSYQEAIRSQNLVAVPEDWILVLTDIVGSTKAIEQGRYKEVNVLGASCIISLLNIHRDIKIPYAFGGDGATILIPPGWENTAREVLSSTRQTAEETFHMGLRVMFIPVKDLVEKGKHLFVSKFKLSQTMTQAVIQGDGLGYAEDLLRTVDGESYQLKHGMVVREADYTGLECRWQPLTSNHGKMISLLIKVHHSSTEKEAMEYEEIYNWIQNKFKDAQPVSSDRLKLENNLSAFKAEVMLKNGEDVLWVRWIILLINQLGKLLLKIKSFNFEKYFTNVVTNSDYLKFDGMMRMILDLSEDHIRELRDYLEEKHQQGLLNYGIHVSSEAQMTCLVFNRKEDHIHFVDGSNGGYALAAKQLKSQMPVKA